MHCTWDNMKDFGDHCLSHSSLLTILQPAKEPDVLALINCT
jgi:hypothetical protein